VGTRIVSVLLIALLVIVHAQLWVGRGSIPSVNTMQRKLSEQSLKNVQAQADNERLAAEVKDLREGLEMVEEKARQELGMVKPNEIFVQIAR
jgi:cell division protein FtsB